MSKIRGLLKMRNIKIKEIEYNDQGQIISIYGTYNKEVKEWA